MAKKKTAKKAPAKKKTAKKPRTKSTAVEPELAENPADLDPNDPHKTVKAARARAKQYPKKPETKEKGRRGPKPHKGPLTESDWEDFERYCEMQATILEIAAWFRCDQKTLNNRCLEYYGDKLSVVYREKRRAGKVSLRRAQWNKALDGNVSMLIWLGKQYLGQSDKVEETEGDYEADELAAESGDDLEKRVKERLKRMEAREARNAKRTKRARKGSDEGAGGPSE